MQGRRKCRPEIIKESSFGANIYTQEEEVEEYDDKPKGFQYVEF